ncbi:MAG: GtrA family protein [Candidatus Zambryskibacteria bacterium]|nr:GtrA family protein [Candidatus Zambryskibacteria bacterium]
MRILITTGIYPPQIGGPAQYAKNLKKEFENLGHEVCVKTYDIENKLPTGIRHGFFFLKIIFSVLAVDFVLTLDNFSVGLPTVFACKLLNKKCVLRTGGDFLYEGYVERTKKKVLLRNFYQTEIPNFSLKEKIIFKLTKWTLNNSLRLVFSTEWQRDIFAKPYNLNLDNTLIIENYYGPKENINNLTSKEFVGSTRNLVWKNLDTLQKVFEKIKSKYPDINLFLENEPFQKFMERIKSCYAVILVSLGDISPNMILDAIRFNKSFICTKEVGIYDRIKDAGIFVNPLDENEIVSAMEEMMSAEGYQNAKEKINKFNFEHTWNNIAEEFVRVFKALPDIANSNIIKNLWHSFIFLRYFLCGITSAGLNILVLYLLTDIVGIWYLYSSIMAFIISLIVSFTLQKFVVFKDMITAKLHYQFSKFTVALILGTITNTILIYVFTDLVGIWYIFSQILAGFFVMIQNFLLYKFFIFNK